MADTDKFNAQVEGLERELRAKLGLRGKTLCARLGKAGRLLPKRLHRAGRRIMDAQTQLSHPKLSRLVDRSRLESAFADFSLHLDAIDPADRRKGRILGWLGGLVFNLLLVVVLAVVLVKWQAG